MIIESVYHFNREVIKSQSPENPTALADAEHKWMVAALMEEAEELSEAFTVAEQVDALVDSIYYAVGGLYRLGLTEEQAKHCFDIVHGVNCLKVGGVNARRPNDGTVVDAVKPDNMPDPATMILAALGI